MLLVGGEGTPGRGGGRVILGMGGEKPRGDKHNDQSLIQSFESQYPPLTHTRMFPKLLSVWGTGVWGGILSPEMLSSWNWGTGGALASPVALLHDAHGDHAPLLHGEEVAIQKGRAEQDLACGTRTRSGAR